MIIAEKLRSIDSLPTQVSLTYFRKEKESKKSSTLLKYYEEGYFKGN